MVLLFKDEIWVRVRWFFMWNIYFNLYDLFSIKTILKMKVELKMKRFQGILLFYLFPTFKVHIQ